jgi:hypothetical protein
LISIRIARSLLYLRYCHAPHRAIARKLTGIYSNRSIGSIAIWYYSLSAWYRQ